MKHLLQLLILLTILVPRLLAQNTCSERLRQAQRNFDEGLLDDIPTMIDSCMKSGFTEEEKMNAFRLLIQTYLFNEETEKADETMLQFLREIPSYRISITDLKEFINLYNTYQTDPIFKWEIYAGATYSYPYVTEHFSIGNLNAKKTSYQSALSAQAGLNITNRINSQFDWEAGFSANLYRAAYTNNELDFATLSATFTNVSVGAPIAIRFSKNIAGVKAFIKGGVEFSYLLSANADFSRTFINGDTPIKNTENLLDMCNRFDVKPLFAIGVSFKIQNKYELAPSLGIKLATISNLKKDKIIRNNDLIYKYTYSGDAILQNLLYLNLALTIPYYNPKKNK